MSSEDVYNVAAPNVSFYTPAQNPPAGTVVKQEDVPKPFQPITIRGVEFPNRIFLSPLNQYSAQDGAFTHWHLVHLGGIISRGPGLSLVEATSVTPEGRGTPQCPGLWDDKFIDGLRDIVDYAHSQGTKIGIQLGHMGRKASMTAPWLGTHISTKEVGGWPDEVVAPSAIAWGPAYPTPKALTVEGIQRIVTAFADAAVRAVKAGVDVIEIHNAHGYLLHEFVSPISNKRTDQYGGSFENRTRFTVEVVDAIRAVIPESMPLFLRISASDLVEDTLPEEPSWRSEDTVRLAHILAEHGVDLIDISSGANSSAQSTKGFSQPGYQAHFAEAVKKSIGDKILVGSVGGINTGHVAKRILDNDQADVVLVGRWFLKNPGLVFQFAEDLGLKLGVDLRVARQMEWPFAGRGARPAIVEQKQ